LLAPAALAAMRMCHGRGDATSGVDPSANMPDCAKTLVFLSRCSNSDAVFAIPAGTGRYRHSLMAKKRKTKTKSAAKKGAKKTKRRKKKK
jgi:hypothetical protein